jgi:ATP-dependent RNA helicase DHX57
MSELRREYASALEKLGFSQPEPSRATANVDEERKTRQLVKAVLIAGLYPRVVRVRRTHLRYVETSGGSVLADPEARDLVFLDEQVGGGGQRVFIHPGSVLFAQHKFNFPFLVYGDKVLTSKPFVRDVTCAAPYGFLLFGGQIRVDHANAHVWVDEKFKFKCGARIGVLIKELRALLDDLLEAKINNPLLDVSSSDVVFAVKKCVEGDGVH